MSSYYKNLFNIIDIMLVISIWVALVIMLVIRSVLAPKFLDSVAPTAVSQLLTHSLLV